MSSNKRKNEELDSTDIDQLNKRVALDSEQLAATEQQEEEAQTAPAIGPGDGDVKVESTPEVQGETEPAPKDESEPTEPAVPASATEESGAASSSAGDEYANNAGKNAGGEPYFEDNTPSGETDHDVNQSGSKPISNHRERENDPTYVHFRMYCPVKEASCIVGKKGEKINHIRDKANVRMQVSDNLKGVPERIISVRGPAENVARAFGLITRTILEEPEDEPASMMSRQYNLKILVPHPMIGYIIGKQGLKFREIEENSAAKLKAAEQPLPYSTDRILSITGVGDAIHIAIYYISQVMIEHKECLKKNKIIYYNTANYQNSPQNLPNATNNNSMMNISMAANPNMMMIGGQAQGANPMANPSMAMPYSHEVKQPQQYAQQPKQPYNFQMMFQPATHPQQHYGTMASAAPPIMAPPPVNQYTDEHGNNIIGDVITDPPVQAGPHPDKFNQVIYVANINIGSVIGKGGNNIKQIREKSGCTYVKIEPDRGHSIMLGGGKGLTNIRKLTLTGTINSIQMAIYLINQRIIADKERNSH